MAEIITPLEAAAASSEELVVSSPLAEGTEGLLDSASSVDGALVVDTKDESPSDDPQSRELLEAKKKAAELVYLSDPEVQAEIVFQNYVKSSGRILSGQQKRALRREILRNAKNGRYKHMFSKEALERQEKKNVEKFGNLNSPS